MDLHLTLLADANFHVGIAEDACSEQAWTTARINLDKAEASLAELRSFLPDMGSKEQGLLGAMVAPLHARYERVSRRLPALAVVTQGAVETDAEDEEPPQD